MSRCKHCKTRIRWVRLTPSNRRLPVNAVPVADGEVTAWEGIDGDLVGFVISRDRPPIAGRRRWRIHKVSCPTPQTKQPARSKDQKKLLDKEKIMSAFVKLSPKLPGDPEINGLDELAETIAQPDEIYAVLAWVKCSKVTKDLETGTEVPTVEIRRIEPIAPVGATPDEVVRLAADLYHRRTGRDPLPFEELVASHHGEVEVVDSPETDSLL